MYTNKDPKNLYTATVFTDGEARPHSNLAKPKNGPDGTPEFVKPDGAEPVSFSMVKCNTQFKNGYREFDVKDIVSFSGSPLEAAAPVINILNDTQPFLVTHNGKNYDLPLLANTAAEYGIPFHYLNLGGKWDHPLHMYSSKTHFDTCFDAAGRFLKLSNLCGRFRIPCKIGMSGADVAKYYDEGRISEIVAYNEMDAIGTYVVAGKLLRMRDQMTDEGLKKSENSLRGYLLEHGFEREHLFEFNQAWGAPPKEHFDLAPSKIINLEEKLIERDSAEASEPNDLL